MADQQETIIIDIDDAKAIVAAARTNAALERIEKKAGKVAGSLGRVSESASTGLVKTVERTARATAEAQTGFGRLFNSMDGFITKMRGFNVALGGMTFGLAGAAVATTKLVTSMGELAEQEQLMADRTGLTIGEVRQLQAASKIAGVNLDALTTGMKTLSEAMSDSSVEGERGKRTLRTLGISATDTNQRLKSTGALINDIAGAVSKLSNVPEQRRALTALFGRGGGELLPLLKQLPQLRAELARLGVGIDDGLTERLAKADDAMDKLGLQWDELKRKFAAKIVATIEFAVGPGGGSAAFGGATGLAGRAGIEGAFGMLERLQAFTGLHPLPRVRTPTPESAFGQIEATNQQMRSAAWRRYIEGGSGAAAILGKIKRAQEELQIAEQEQDVAAHKAATRKLENLKSELDAIDKLKDAYRDAYNDVRQAQLAGLEGMQRINAELDLKMEQLRREGVLTATIVKLREQERMLLIGAERDRQVKAARATLAGVPEETEQAFRTRNVALAQERIDSINTVFKEQQDIWQLEDQLQIASIENRKDAEIRAAEAIAGRSLESRIEAAQRVAEVEEKYALELLRVRTQHIYQEAEIRAAVAQTSAERNIAYLKAGAEAAIVAEETQGRIATARETATQRRLELIRTEQERIFENMRHSVEGVIDALITRTRSLGDALKAAILTPVLAMVKQIASYAVTSALLGTGIAMPGTGGMTRGPGGGGGLGGLFGGGLGFPGAPGGTVGIAGPVGGGGGAGRAGGFGGLGFGRLSNLFFNRGSISLGGGRATTAAGLGGIRGGLAGFATSPMGLLAGTMLAGYGLQRGGKAGIPMSAGGGALIGAYLGTAVFPGIGTALGAGIGAAAGGIAGLIRFFHKGAADKVQSKVRQMYGVTIDSKFAKDPLARIIKEQFGGNIEVGLRSPQIRELIQMYAMSRGQALTGALAPVALPSSFGMRGSQLITQPTYYNSQPVSVANMTPAAPPASNITVNLDPDATRSFWETQTLNVVGEHPEAVQSANLTAASRNINRRQLTAAQFAPGVVTG